MPGVQLFSDKKFFLLQRVPARASLIQDIERHGGRVVKLEVQADYVIADHLRKDAPAGSISYTFIETAIRQDALPDESRHLATTATAGDRASARPGVVLGSQTGRSTRTPFTAEDDKELWDWVTTCEAAGGSVRGNEIYKELERKNARHTYHSWRDRYLKTLSSRPPPVAARRAPPTPESGPSPPQSAGSTLHGVQPPRRQRPVTIEVVDELEAPADPPPEARDRLPAGFTEQELEDLIDEAPSIEDIPYSKWDAAWEAWARLYESPHSAKQWEAFYKSHARNEYLRREAAKADAVKSAKEPELVRLDGSSSQLVDATEAASTPPAKRRRINDDRSREATLSASSRRSRLSGSFALFVPGSPVAILSSRHSTPRASALQASPSRAPIESPRPSANSNGHQMVQSTPMAHISPSTRRSMIQESMTSPSVQTVHQHRQTLSSQPSTPKPASLTAANLAQMRAQHRRSDHQRATDMAEDDEDQDQTEYAGVLYSLLPERMLALAAKPALPLDSDAVASPQVTTPQLPQKPPKTHRRVSLGHSAARDAARRVSDILSGKSKRDSLNAEAPSTPPPARRVSDILSGKAKRESFQAAPLKAETARRVSDILSGKAKRDSLPADAPPTVQATHRLSKVVNSEDKRDSLHADMASKAQPARRTSDVLSGQDHRDSPHASTASIAQPRPSRQPGTKAAVTLASSTFRMPRIFMQPAPPAAEQVAVELDRSSHPARLSELHHSSRLSHSSEHASPMRNITANKTRPISKSATPSPDNDGLLSVGEDSEAFNNRRHLDFLRNDPRPVSPIPEASDQTVDAYIDAKVKSGFKDYDVIRALDATCMRTRLASAALKVLSQKGKLPAGVSGIWTDSDDEDLGSKDAARVARVTRKHGPRELQHRRYFLEQMNG